jgi:hypothetical protein
MKMDPRNPALYDDLISREEDMLRQLMQQIEDAQHRIDQLRNLRALASEYAGTTAPQLGITVQHQRAERPGRPVPHKYGEDGRIVIPPAKRTGRGRPPASLLAQQLVVTNYLRSKDLSMSDIARHKAGFGSTLKRTADLAGREYERELVHTSSFDAEGKTVERIVWREADRDLFDYVFNRSYSHLLP